MWHNPRNSAKIISSQGLHEAAIRVKIIRAMTRALLESQTQSTPLAAPTQSQTAPSTALDGLKSGSFVFWNNLPRLINLPAYRTNGRGPGEERLAAILGATLGPPRANFDFSVSNNNVDLERWEVKSVDKDEILLGTGSVRECSRICAEYSDICSQLLKFLQSDDNNSEPSQDFKLVEDLKLNFDKLSASASSIVRLRDIVVKHGSSSQDFQVTSAKIDVTFKNRTSRTRRLRGDQIDADTRRSIIDILLPSKNTPAIRQAFLTHDAFHDVNSYDAILASFAIGECYPDVKGFYLVDESGVKKFDMQVARERFSLKRITLGGRAVVNVGNWRI